MIRIISTFAIVLSCLSSFSQEVQPKINADWIKDKKVAFVGFDDVFTEKSKEEIANKWNVGTILDPRQKRANQNVIVDTNVVVVAPVIFINDGDSILGITAFQGNKKWKTPTTNKKGVMLWPKEEMFLARVILDNEKFNAHMLVTYICAVNDLLNWNLSTQDPEILSKKLQEGEWVGTDRIMYVDSMNLIKNQKKTKFNQLKIKNLKVIKYDNLKLELRSPKTDAYYLDRRVIVVEKQRVAITYLYSLNNGLVGFYTDVLPERVSGELTEEYLRFLVQPLPPKGGLDPKFQKRDIPECRRY